MEGIACSTGSLGNRALTEAVEYVKGSVTPYSIMGRYVFKLFRLCMSTTIHPPHYSLPLVRDLQRNGFDIQLIGFGKSSVYHGDNEYCLLSDMKDALRILCRVIETAQQE